jgi:hypothetical protein
MPLLCAPKSNAPISHQFLRTCRRKFAANPCLRDLRLLASARKYGTAAWERIVRWSLADDIRELSRTFAQLRNSYRPELHYMRGPGPKWHAKRAGIATDSTVGQADVEPVFEIANAGV